MAKTSAKHVYGWKRDLPDHRDFKVEHLHIADLPEAVDLRPKMPKVYDQGALGSCTANGIGATFEHALISQGLIDFTPSRLFIYFNERFMEHTVNEDAGAAIRDGIKVVVNQGVCSETEWPYVINRFTVKPSPNCYAHARQNIAESYESISQNLITLKSHIASGYPIVFGITVFESFESEEVAKTGIVPMPKLNEENLGGHCVVIVGYDNEKNSFLVRNSWGEDWGIQGHCYLPYSYVTNPGLASDFWIIKLVK